MLMDVLCPSLLPLLQAAGYSSSAIIGCTSSSGTSLCIIDLDAIAANIAMLRRHLLPGTRMMAMVKAHAYGSDGAMMAQFFTTYGVDILCAAHVAEAVTLRRSGVAVPLFAINAAPHEAQAVVSADIEVGVGNLATIRALGDAARTAGRSAKLHLHVDTGMRRFGCRPSDSLELAREIVAHPYLQLEGLMTHFAAADDRQHDAFTEQQIAQFDAVVAILASASISPKWIHAANSSATLRFHLPQYNMVRLGLALWGFYVSDATRNVLPLVPALTLLSQIHEIHLCRRGETVSYGCNYEIVRPEQAIAVLPIGYCDGLHRHYSGKGQVLIAGQLAPMVGNICMDYMMVDVTDIPQAAIGEPVVIFGQNRHNQLLPLEGLAQSGNSIAHELIACLGTRIPRVFVHSGQPRLFTAEPKGTPRKHREFLAYFK